LEANFSCWAAHVFGEGPVAGAEHLVAGSKLRHVLADRLDLPRRIEAPAVALRSPEPQAHQAAEIRVSAHFVPVVRIDSRCVHPDEHAVRVDRRLVDLDQLELIGRAVLGADDRLHCVLQMGNVHCK